MSPREIGINFVGDDPKVPDALFACRGCPSGPDQRGRFLGDLSDPIFALIFLGLGHPGFQSLCRRFVISGTRRLTLVVIAVAMCLVARQCLRCQCIQFDQLILQIALFLISKT